MFWVQTFGVALCFSSNLMRGCWGTAEIAKSVQIWYNKGYFDRYKQRET